MFWILSRHGSSGLDFSRAANQQNLGSLSLSFVISRPAGARRAEKSLCRRERVAQALLPVRCAWNGIWVQPRVAVLPTLSAGSASAE